MADQETPTPHSNKPFLHPPSNVYYTRPYSFFWPGVFIFVGAFACAGLTDTVSRGTSILLWTVYLLGILILIAIDPLCVWECQAVDENGRSVSVRRPLVGFRSCEQVVPLEVLEQRLYRTEDGEDQPRLRDGYRYGPAFVRI
ncbi:hypothetical protein BDV39DRAFT_207429 [Aspergillus sergii]|uniref:Uncharacterized protein n=1 Tax=Aspergillus sergii TaxID=1034303 RepID=A0A5N6WVI4_9EURO|nr:hypothetical protein BDV39DRAFT_207429 [Aspergillus sergii]